MVGVTRVDGGHRLVGEGSLVEFANRWLGHLEVRQFSPATVRAYAFDLVCLARFFDEVGIDWRQANPTDFFDWLEWQSRPTTTRGQRVVRLDGKRGAAAASMNRRVAAARGLFEHALLCGVVDRNPVARTPAQFRSTRLTAGTAGSRSRSESDGICSPSPSRAPLAREPRRLGRGGVPG